MYSSSRNPLLTNLQSYRIWMTSKIQINFRFRRYWWFCLINFWNFFSIYVFEVSESIFDIPTELPCLGDLENPGQLPVQEILMILSYTFLKIFQYLCFRIQYEVKHLQEALEGNWVSLYLMGTPANLKFLQYSCFRGRGHRHFWYFLSYRQFTRKSWSKLSGTAEVHESSDDCILSNFWNFFSIYVFEVMRILRWHSYWASPCLM